MKQLTNAIKAQFAKMCATGKLFKANIGGADVWDTYLSSFEDDPIFRDPESSVHNCNFCNNFIRRYGNIIAIDDNGQLMTIFDVEAKEEYIPVINGLVNLIKGSKIENVFFETYSSLQKLPYEQCSKTQETYLLGVPKNVKRYTKEEAEKFGVVKPNEIKTFDHLHIDLPKAFVNFTGASIESIQGEYRDKKNVFERAMKEITLDTLILVRDLINQGSLLDGTAHLDVLEQVIAHKRKHDESNRDDNWYWVETYSMSERIAKFKNTLIGVLCTELAEGEELNKACQSWNKRVDPANYMKAVAPITKKQIEEARKFVEENGYTESFNRRGAVPEDIKVTEIKHVSTSSEPLKVVSMFDNVKSTKSRHKRNQFDEVEEVGIEKFMSDILPSCSSVEAYLENKHEGNLVSLTTANNPDSKPIFKWNNNYSWTYKGNLAGKSQIKEAVKTAGGAVDGVLRFSIMWAEKDGDNSDLDAHCMEPTSEEIYFSNKRSYQTGGQLDIDITQPQSQMPNGAVENIVYPSLNKMVAGDYKFFVQQYSARSSKGFKAEIEFDGQIYSFNYDKPVRGNVQVAVVTLKNRQFSIDCKLPESMSTKTMYGLETNNFHKVNLISLSPNHWGENSVGNKHYFFMLEGCKPDTAIRSFHNENLITELTTHRKVMEVLASTNLIEPANKQLSGLGFNATIKDELVVRLAGSHKRVVKLKF